MFIEMTSVVLNVCLHKRVVIMIELKLRAVGSGIGVELPPEVLVHLKATEGETIFLEYMFNGSYRLAKHDEEIVEQTMLIDGLMHEEDA